MHQHLVLEYGTTPVFFKCNFQKKTFDIEVGCWCSQLSFPNIWIYCNFPASWWLTTECTFSGVIFPSQLLACDWTFRLASWLLLIIKGEPPKRYLEWLSSVGDACVYVMPHWAWGMTWNQSEQAAVVHIKTEKNGRLLEVICCFLDCFIISEHIKATCCVTPLAGSNTHIQTFFHQCKIFILVKHH